MKATNATAGIATTVPRATQLQAHSCWGSFVAVPLLQWSACECYELSIPLFCASSTSPL